MGCEAAGRPVVGNWPAPKPVAGPPRTVMQAGNSCRQARVFNATVMRMPVTSKVGRWMGLKVARRLARTVPVLGAVVSLAVLGYSVRRKGLLLGLIDTGLDALPVVGAAKGGL